MSGSRQHRDMRPARPPAAGRTRYGRAAGPRWPPVLGGSLLMLVLLHPAQARADAADFQGMPGMWKVQYQEHDQGRAGPAASYWLCADDGSDPMDTFAAVEIPALSSCQRSSIRRTTTSLSWRLSCAGGRQGLGQIRFDRAEHYVGRIELPAEHHIIQLEALHYAACTGPSD